MKTISDNIQKICHEIKETAKNCDRDPKKITLLAVSKFQNVEKVQKAIDVGLRNFGENYIQEGCEKIKFFAKNSDLIWHFIGVIQSNKTHLLAKNFDWVQTIDRIKIAKRLNEQRSEAQSNLNILIQINIDNDPNKSGILAEDLFSFAKELMQFPRLTLRGLMTITKENQSNEKIRESFKKMNELFTQLQKKYTEIDTLSIGMSQDFKLAIQENSTLIRVGTAIFGERNAN